MWKRRRHTATLVLGLLAALAGRRSSHVEPPGVEGRPVMINDDGQPRLWVLTKHEEIRQVSVGC